MKEIIRKLSIWGISHLYIIGGKRQGWPRWHFAALCSDVLQPRRFPGHSRAAPGWQHGTVTSCTLSKVGSNVPALVTPEAVPAGVAGNGGNAAAHAINKALEEKGVLCSVVAVPKSIGEAGLWSWSVPAGGPL